MKVRNLISGIMLVSALSTPAFASSFSFGADSLYSNPNLNKKLDMGNYDFSKQHSRYGSYFTDTWKFTVASDSSASISISDLGSTVGSSHINRQAKFHQLQLRQFRGPINTSKVFSTNDLSISIFNNRGELIGKTDGNGKLDHLDLFAGNWYTIKVTGKVDGFFRGSYHGVFDCHPTEVPLGETAPMFGSALALLVWRVRRRFSNVV